MRTLQRLLLMTLSLLVPAAAAAASAAPAPLRWSAPEQIDTQPPYGNALEIDVVSCPSASLCVAGDGTGAITTSTDPAADPATWVTSQVASAAIRSISCPSTTLCLAVDAAGELLTSTDPTGAWQASTLVGPDTLKGVSCASISLCVAYFEHGNLAVSTDPAGGPASWRPQGDITGNTITALSCPSDSLCVGVDSGGDLITSTDPTGGLVAWRVQPVDPASTRLGSGFTTISCPSTSLCVAGDVVGDVFFTTYPWVGASTWNAERIDSTYVPCGYQDCPAAIAALDCSSDAACVALDVAGNEFGSASPGAGVAWSRNAGRPNPKGNLPGGLSCPTDSLCLATGDGVMYASSDPLAATATWTPTAVFDGTNTITSVSCRPSFCAVVDSSGHLLSSRAPQQGASVWSSVRLGVQPIQSLSCPSASLCAGVDAGGQIVTTAALSGPAAGWSAATLSVPALSAVTCPSIRLCVAAGDGRILTSVDPLAGASSWSVEAVDHDGILGRLAGLSCPSVSLCAAVDWGGNVLVSRDPAGGPAAWHEFKIASVGIHGKFGLALTALSCATASQCVAFDNRGNSFVSTNPAGGPTAWVAHRAILANGFFGVDCVSAMLCLATYGDQLATSRDPTSVAPWRLTAIDSGQRTLAVASLSCMSPSLCVAASGEDVLVGTRSGAA